MINLKLKDCKGDLDLNVYVTVMWQLIKSWWPAATVGVFNENVTSVGMNYNEYRGSSTTEFFRCTINTTKT